MIQFETALSLTRRAPFAFSSETIILFTLITNSAWISAMVSSNSLCPNYYIGIGITQSFWGDVEFVAPGGPAYNAGIKAGDLLLTKINNSQLKEDQIIQVSFSREGIITTYSIKVERICKDEDT